MNFSVPKNYVQWEGWPTAIFLSRMEYLCKKAKREDGFVYKSMPELEAELCLSEYQINKARKCLKSHGILEEKVELANGSPTVHYRINTEKLTHWVKIRGSYPKNLGATT